MNAFRLSVRAGLLLGAWLILAGWLAWLAHGSWQFQQSLNQAAAQAPPAAEPVARAQPNPQAVARLFGVQLPEHNSDVPRVPLTLVASLMDSRAEQSRALIESPEGSRFYSIGETLPGGGTLRQIDASEIRIQRFGEELTLALAQHETQLLIPQTQSAGTANLLTETGTASLLQPSPQPLPGTP